METHDLKLLCPHRNPSPIDRLPYEARSIFLIFKWQALQVPSTTSLQNNDMCQPYHDIRWTLVSVRLISSHLNSVIFVCRFQALLK